MRTEKNLEEEIELIINPNGPDKKATEELIKALSTVFTSNTSPKVKEYTRGIIKGVGKGYEMQTGEKYEGFFPEEV